MNNEDVPIFAITKSKQDHQILSTVDLVHNRSLNLHLSSMRKL